MRHEPTNRESLLETSIDEDSRRRFEAAWRANRPESIKSCLPPHDQPSHLPTLLELVRIELEFAWKEAGQQNDACRTSPPVVENYLQQFPQLDEPSLIQILAQQEYLVRNRYGDRPSKSHFQDRFPQITLTLLDFETLPADGGPKWPTAVPQIPGSDILSALARGGLRVV